MNNQKVPVAQWIAHQTSDLGVVGSSPIWDCFYLCYMYLLYISYINVRGSIVVSIPACHAGDPGSIPGLGVFLINYANQFNNFFISIKRYETNIQNILYHSNSFSPIGNSFA